MQASKTALTIFQLQHTLKNARVVYSSATIATNPDNLECLLRLGLWGPRTSFKDSATFADAMRNAGLPGLELLALNLKSEGKFLSRCLGFKVGQLVCGPSAIVFPKYARLWTGWGLSIHSSFVHVSPTQGCEFQVVRAPISPEFEQVYDLCARQWELLRQVRRPFCLDWFVLRLSIRSFVRSSRVSCSYW